MAPLSKFFYLAFTIVSLFVMDTSSQATLPPCVEACLDTAASSSGCSPTDPICVCNNAAIADAVATCIVAQCSAADAEAAVTFFDEFCSGATPSSSASVSVEPSTIESSASETPSSILSAPSSILSTPSNTSTPGSSPSSSFTSSEPATSTQPSTTQEQSTTGPTTSITSRPSTGSTASPASATSSTTSTTPGVTNHGERGRTAGSYTSIVFALALALVIW